MPLRVGSPIRLAGYRGAGRRWSRRPGIPSRASTSISMNTAPPAATIGRFPRRSPVSQARRDTENQAPDRTRRLRWPASEASGAWRSLIGGCRCITSSTTNTPVRPTRGTWLGCARRVTGRITRCIQLGITGDADQPDGLHHDVHGGDRRHPELHQPTGPPPCGAANQPNTPSGNDFNGGPSSSPTHHPSSSPDRTSTATSLVVEARSANAVPGFRPASGRGHVAGVVHDGPSRGCRPDAQFEVTAIDGRQRRAVG